MPTQATAKRFSWDRPIGEVWEELSRPSLAPDMPLYQKLALLVQLNAAQARDDTALAVAGYTKWRSLV